MASLSRICWPPNSPVRRRRRSRSSQPRSAPRVFPAFEEPVPGCSGGKTTRCCGAKVVNGLPAVPRSRSGGRLVGKSLVAVGLRGLGRRGVAPVMVSRTRCGTPLAVRGEVNRQRLGNPQWGDCGCPDIHGTRECLKRFKRLVGGSLFARVRPARPGLRRDTVSPRATPIGTTLPATTPLRSSGLGSRTPAAAADDQRTPRCRFAWGFGAPGLNGDACVNYFYTTLFRRRTPPVWAPLVALVGTTKGLSRLHPGM
jgi:hypothetical protein